MSSSRRKGRSPVSPAAGRPASAVDAAPEAAAAEEIAEEIEGAQEVAQEAATDAADSAGDTVATDTAAIPEIPTETSPETVQAAVAASVTDGAEQAADTVEMVPDETLPVETVPSEVTATVVETAQAVTEQSADAVAQATETVEAAQAQAVEQVAEQPAATVEQVADNAMALAAAPLAVAATFTASSGGERSGSEAGTRFAFVPAFEPLNEINATLFAFARGEGEAAVAHFQALTKAKSPAEAIRLQVSEFQRAADASLTCFSHILRSANRFGGAARWH